MDGTCCDPATRDAHVTLYKSGTKQLSILISMIQQTNFYSAIVPYDDKPSFLFNRDPDKRVVQVCGSREKFS